MVFPGSPTPQRAAQELQRRHAGAQGVSWRFFIRRKIQGKNVGKTEPYRYRIYNGYYLYNIMVIIGYNGYRIYNGYKMVI
jgi:hypothetical protein